MARARNIKPGFFKNEALAECGPWARLCFAGLWLLADRDGRLEDRPKRIKGELFAYDSVEVDPLLCELEAHEFLVRYENEAGRFIQILAFKKHQTPHYSEKASAIKPPTLQEKGGHMQAPDSRSTPGVLPETSGSGPVIKAPPQPPDSLIPDSLIPDSLNPEEDSGSALRAEPPTPPPAFDGNNGASLNGKAIVCIATGWELPTEWGFDAEALGFKPAEVLREAEKFRQYWTAGKGKGQRRSVKGWRQSWSNWLDKAARDTR